MIDSIEKLAQSRTFIVRNGAIAEDDHNLPAARRDRLNPGAIVESKYQIIELIGTGGMGAVYKVRHLLLKKEMALKTFLSRKLSEGTLLRFQREAQAIARLQHKNIVHVYDFGEAEGHLPYYTMELLSGHSLADELKQLGRMDPIDALQIFAQVAEALAHAHRHNIVHRDIKPANIILVSDSSTHTGSPPVKLVDFGIAKLAEDTTYKADQSLTQAGTIFGSPLYMSPEQSLGLATDFRTDMYSFGCALYESLTGDPPFVGSTALHTMLMHQTERPPALQESGLGFAVPQRLEALLEKLLAKNPHNRYQKFDQIVEELGLCSLALSSGGSAPSAYPSNTGNTFLIEVKERLGEDTVEKFQKLPIKKILVASTAIVALGAGLFASFKPTYDSVNKPGVVQQAAKPFYVGMRHDKDGDKRIFSFGDLQEFGSLAVYVDGKLKKSDCAGIVAMPADKAIHFCPEETCLAHPELLRRFGQDDLYAVRLIPVEALENQKIPPFIEELSHLSGLRVLDLSLSEITPKTLKLLDNLKNLKVLDVQSCGNIQGKDLASLTILPNLESLTVSELTDLSPIWKALAGSNAQLRILTANRCKLSDQDFTYLGQLPHLAYISMTNAQISIEQLRYLNPPANLQQLNLTHDYSLPKHIPIFARFTKLRKITLYKSSFKGADLQGLVDALPPHCIIEDDNIASEIIVAHDF